MAEDASHTAFVTVGAHDPNGQMVDFSNTGEAVDLLAPGCGIPTYELKAAPPQPPRLSRNHVNGTSFAAPVVSFVAGLLATDHQFSGKPGLIKTRLILSVDFNADLAGKVFSSGIMNARKALSFNFDVVELTSAKAADLGLSKEPIRLGKLKPPDENFGITCDNQPVPFAEIEKFSIDVARPGKAALVMSNKTPTVMNTLRRGYCAVGDLPSTSLEFEDRLSGQSIALQLRDIRDYVRAVNP